MEHYIIIYYLSSRIISQIYESHVINLKDRTIIRKKLRTKMHISPSSYYSKISLHFNTIPIQFFCTTIALNCLYFSAFMSCPSENQNPWKILKNCFPYAGEWPREKGRWRWLARALEISGKLVWFKRAPAQYWRRIGRKNRGCHKSANGNIRPRDSVRERSITNACYKYCVQSGRESEKGVCYDQKFSGPRRKEERKKGNSATPVNLSVAYLLGNLSIGVIFWKLFLD